MRPLVTVIVCHWNAGDRTARCLQQIPGWDYPLDRIEVIAQDSASTDGSAPVTQRAIEAIAAQNPGRWLFRRLESHPGLTAAMNEAVQIASPESKYFLRLDNDVELAADCLGTLVEAMEQGHDVGAAGPRIFYAKERSRLQAGAIFINWWGLKGVWADPPGPTEVDTLLGAVMLVRRKAVEALGRWFDPEFFLFQEEGEFCQAILRSGFSSLYIPSAHAWHDSATSTGKHPPLSEYLSAHNSIVFFRRYSTRTQFLVSTAVALARALKTRVAGRGPFSWWGVVDGLLRRRLSKSWWQSQIRTATFERPR